MRYFQTTTLPCDTMSEDPSKVIQEEAEVAESGEKGDRDTAAMPPPPEKAIDIEKMEEQKLKSKFPGELMR